MSLLTPSSFANSFTALAGAATWNPSDKAASWTLSNGNLTASTASPSANSWVNANKTRNSGKYYFEITLGNHPGPNNLFVQFAALANRDFTPGTGFSFRTKSSNIVGEAGGYSMSTSWTAGTGSVLRFAVDLNNYILYLGHNGSWTGMQNPFTETGGFVFGTPTAIQLSPQLLLSNNPVTATANFGQTPFIYPKPSAFTGGFN